jgi:hypothetical protein
VEPRESGAHLRRAGRCLVACRARLFTRVDRSFSRDSLVKQGVCLHASIRHVYRSPGCGDGSLWGMRGARPPRRDRRQGHEVEAGGQRESTSRRARGVRAALAAVDRGWGGRRDGLRRDQRAENELEMAVVCSEPRCAYPRLLRRHRAAAPRARVAIPMPSSPSPNIVPVAGSGITVRTSTPSCGR